VAKEILDLFGDRVIRRDLSSRQFDGTLIIDLPPLIHTKVELSMSEHDQKWFEEVMAANTHSQRRLARMSRKVGFSHCTFQTIDIENRIFTFVHGKVQVSLNTWLGLCATITNSLHRSTRI
jgi:hypothetical protein